MKRSATRDAAEFFGSDEFGVVEVGKRADLLLLNCNPLADLSCANIQVGVMTRGKWFTKQKLDKLWKSD